MLAYLEKLVAITGCALVVCTGQSLAGAEGAVASTFAMGGIYSLFKAMGPSFAATWISDKTKAGLSKADLERRRLQNHDLYLMMGRAIEIVIDDTANDLAKSDKAGSAYMKRVQRGVKKAWSEYLPSCQYKSIVSPNTRNYFLGSPTQIKAQKALDDPSEWEALIEELVGSPTTDEKRAFEFVARRLQERYAAAVWEASKRAWKKDDLAWPALILRLMSELSGGMVKVAKIVRKEGQRTVDPQKLSRGLRMLADNIHGRAKEIVDTLGDKMDENQRGHSEEINGLSREILHALDHLDARLSGIEANTDRLPRVDSNVTEVLGRTRHVENLLKDMHESQVASAAMFELVKQQVGNRFMPSDAGILQAPSASQYPRGNLQAAAPPINPGYVDRPDSSGTIITALTDDTNPRALCVCGHAGMGKTELVRSIAQTYMHDIANDKARFDAIWWVDADPEFSPDWLAVLGQRLGVDDPAIKSPQELHEEVARCLSDGRKHLLVIDNADCPEISHSIPAVTGCRVLVTSRIRNWPTQRVRIVDLDPMAKAEAVSLLRGFRDDVGEGQLETIAELTGYHPLALTMCGSWLARPSHPDPERLVRLLSTPPTSDSHPLLSHSLLRSATDYISPALSALAAVFESITEAEEVQFVRICGLMAPEVIPVELLAHAAGTDYGTAEDVVDSLHSLGVGRTIPAIGDTGFGGFLVHRLVQQAIRMRLRQCPKAELQSIVRSVEDALWKVLTNCESNDYSLSTQASSIHACAFLEFVDHASDRRIDEFHSVSRETDIMLVHAAAAMPLIAKGAMGLAKERACRAELMLREMPVVHDGNRALVQLSYGFISLIAGNYVAAEDALVPGAEYLRAQADIDGDTSLVVATYGLRALAYMGLADNVRAFECLTEGIQWIKANGDAGEDLATLLWYRSITGFQLGKVEEAETDMRQIIQQVDIGGDALAMAAARIPLAISLRRRGEFEKALRIYEKAYEAIAEGSDPGVPVNVAALALPMAELNLDLDRVSEAANQLKIASAEISGQEPPQPLVLALLRHSSARHALLSGEIEEGLGLIEQTLELLNTMGRRQCVLFSSAQIVNGLLLMAADRLPEAAAVFADIVTWCREYTPEDSQPQAVALFYEGKARRDINDQQNALNALSQGLSLIQSDTPFQLDLSRKIQLVRATVFSKLGATSNAVRDARAALDLANGPPPIAPLDAAIGQSVLAHCKMIEGNHLEAKSWANEAISNLEMSTPISFDAVSTRLLRSEVMHILGDYDAALVDANTAVATLDQLPAVDPTWKYKALKRRTGTLWVFVISNCNNDKAEQLALDFQAMASLGGDIGLDDDAIATSRVGSGIALLRMGDWESASNELSVAIESFKSRPPLYYQAFMHRAGALLQQGLFTAAEIDASYAEPVLREQLGITHPDYLTNLTYRAQAFLSLDRLVEARQDIQELCTQLEPIQEARFFFAQSVSLRAKLCERENDIESAAADYGQVIELCDTIGKSDSPVAVHARDRKGQIG